jgi:hypothetical protein
VFAINSLGVFSRTMTDRETARLIHAGFEQVEADDELLHYEARLVPRLA